MMCWRGMTSDLPSHTELIDGSLVFPDPRSSYHQLTLWVLESGLLSTVPGGGRPVA
jgi:hypothetical protein